MTGTAGDDVAELLARDRAFVTRSSTTERVADLLRNRIIEGTLAPGVRLSEERIASALGVSRNTLREAFRLLTHEGLLVHELNRGVSVRVLTVRDVADLFELRRVVECGVLRRARPSADRIAAVETAVEEGRRARRERDWKALGTANMRFHQALAALAGSPRIDELAARLLAELRLVFHVMADPQRFHEQYLERNHEILEGLRSTGGCRAAELLESYLDEAEHQLVTAYVELVPDTR